MCMMAPRRKVLRTLLLYGSGLMVFGRPEKVFSWRETVKELWYNAGMTGEPGNLMDVSFAIAGMT